MTNNGKKKKSIDRQQNIEQHEPQLIRGRGAPGRATVPAPIVAPVV